MKLLCSAIIFLFISLNAHGQKSIDQVLRKYRNDQGVVTLNFTGESLKKFVNTTKKTIKSEIESVDILVFEKNTNVSSSDIKKIQTMLTASKYEQLIDVKHKDGKVKLYAVDAGPHLTRLYAYVNTNDLNAYIEIKGKVIFNELGDLGLDFNKKASLDVLKSFGAK
jgi:predicted metalloprotease with PDZ domain